MKSSLAYRDYVVEKFKNSDRMVLTKNSPDGEIAGIVSNIVVFCKVSN